jgi:hypothetical protein
MRKLTIDDIPELRAYNKDRDELRRRIIALKARRRFAVGPLVSLVFENTDTVRWQVAEMVRAERITTEDGVKTEVDIYNDMIPDAGELSATMFIELTSEEQLREWLPRLVGIHESVAFRLADGGEVRGVDPDAARLTREEITPAVHFVKFAFTPREVDQFRAGPVRLVIDHPQYDHAIELSDEQRAELAADLAAA